MLVAWRVTQLKIRIFTSHATQAWHHAAESHSLAEQGIQCLGFKQNHPWFPGIYSGNMDLRNDSETTTPLKGLVEFILTYIFWVECFALQQFYSGSNISSFTVICFSTRQPRVASSFQQAPTTRILERQGRRNCLHKRISNLKRLPFFSEFQRLLFFWRQKEGVLLNNKGVKKKYCRHQHSRFWFTMNPMNQNDFMKPKPNTLHV